MPTSIPATSRRAHGIASKVGRALLWAYLVSVIAVCGVLVINGPQMRAAAEAEQARVIADENRRVCAKFGMPHGTANFSECAGALGEVRTHHEERLAAQQAGLL